MHWINYVVQLIDKLTICHEQMLANQETTKKRGIATFIAILCMNILEL